MSKLNIKINKPMLFASILLCLCIVSVYLMNGLYARYYTQVSGDDSARVAKFEVAGSGSLTDSFAVELSPVSDVKKTIQIVSGSETTVEYTVTVKSLQHLPLRFAWDGGSANEIGTFTGTIPPSDSTPRKHELTVSWAEDQNDYIYSYELDYIVVTIDYEQVD